jgi:microfibrillar-associated protein 1
LPHVRGDHPGEAPDLIPDVDDTDDVDPDAEFQLWRLRELSRLARDKQRALEREEEREEIERRRALPAAQRDAEDEEYARRTREEAKDNRGERAFLEKFWHKGAFHQVRELCFVHDNRRTVDDVSKRQDEEILKRNYNVKLESTVDVSLLPKVMQVRNFGKVSGKRLSSESSYGCSIGNDLGPHQMSRTKVSPY